MRLIDAIPALAQRAHALLYAGDPDAAFRALAELTAITRELEIARERILPLNLPPGVAAQVLLSVDPQQQQLQQQHSPSPVSWMPGVAVVPASSSSPPSVRPLSRSGSPIPPLAAAAAAAGRVSRSNSLASSSIGHAPTPPILPPPPALSAAGMHIALPAGGMPGPPPSMLFPGTSPTSSPAALPTAPPHFAMIVSPTLSHHGLSASPPSSLGHGSPSPGLIPLRSPSSVGSATGAVALPLRTHTHPLAHASSTDGYDDDDDENMDLDPDSHMLPVFASSTMSFELHQQYPATVPPLSTSTTHGQPSFQAMPQSMSPTTMFAAVTGLGIAGTNGGPGTTGAAFPSHFDPPPMPPFDFSTLGLDPTFPMLHHHQQYPPTAASEVESIASSTFTATSMHTSSAMMGGAHLLYPMPPMPPMLEGADLAELQNFSADLAKMRPGSSTAMSSSVPRSVPHSDYTPLQPFALPSGVEFPPFDSLMSRATHAQNARTPSDMMASSAAAAANAAASLSRETAALRISTSSSSPHAAMTTPLGASATPTTASPSGAKLRRSNSTASVPGLSRSNSRAKTSAAATAAASAAAATAAATATSAAAAAATNPSAAGGSHSDMLAAARATASAASQLVHAHPHGAHHHHLVSAGGSAGQPSTSAGLAALGGMSEAAVAAAATNAGSPSMLTPSVLNWVRTLQVSRTPIPPTQIQHHTAGTLPTQLPADLISAMDLVFFAYLMAVCSNPNATDGKGEAIHQTMAAKHLEAETCLKAANDLQAAGNAAAAAASVAAMTTPAADTPTEPLPATTTDNGFRVLSFRIQPFTAAFTEALEATGLVGGTTSVSSRITPRKIKVYLWNNQYVRRFNEMGKKAKTKGAHIWSVKARRTFVASSLAIAGDAAAGIGPAGAGRWEWDFSPFTRKIMGQLPAPIIPGVEWTWKAEVWDPNVAKPKPQFSSPALPTWMWWGDEGTLHALAPVSTRPGLYELDVNAVYTVGDTELSTTRHMEVEVLAPGGAPPPATSNGSQGPSAAAVLSGGAAGTATSLAIPSPVTALDYAALVAQLGPESISALYASNFMAAARDGADSSM